MDLAPHLALAYTHLSILRDTQDHKDRVAAFLARKRT